MHSSPPFSTLHSPRSHSTFPSSINLSSFPRTIAPFSPSLPFFCFLVFTPRSPPSLCSLFPPVHFPPLHSLQISMLPSLPHSTSSLPLPHSHFTLPLCTYASLPPAPSSLLKHVFVPSYLRPLDHLLAQFNRFQPSSSKTSWTTIELPCPEVQCPEISLFKDLFLCQESFQTFTSTLDLSHPRPYSTLTSPCPKLIFCLRSQDLALVNSCYLLFALI